MKTYITEADLKANTTIQANVDVALLTDSIEFAQASHIDYVIGERLAARLQSYLVANKLPEEAALKTLLEKIVPALSWWTLYEALPGLHLKITNSAVVVKQSRESESADASSVKLLQHNASNRAEFYTEQLLKFLRSKKQDYPEFPENAPQASTGFSGGIYFPKW